MVRMVLVVAVAVNRTVIVAAVVALALADVYERMCMGKEGGRGSTGIRNGLLGSHFSRVGIRIGASLKDGREVGGCTTNA